MERGKVNRIDVAGGDKSTKNRRDIEYSGGELEEDELGQKLVFSTAGRWGTFLFKHLTVVCMYVHRQSNNECRILKEGRRKT